MHIFLSSGGIAQYEINAMAVKLVKHTPFTLETVDELSSNMRFPKAYGKLTKTFWFDRIAWPAKKNEFPHMKAFASDMRIAIQMMVAFCDLVLHRFQKRVETPIVSLYHS